MWWARLLNSITALLGNGAVAAVGDYESIATVTVGAGGSSSISFTSIPSTYKHLQVRWIGAGTGSPSVDSRFNSDSSGNYTRHRLQGNGTSASADAVTGQTQMSLFGSPGLPSASTFAAVVMDILDYQNTNKYKTVRMLAGVDKNGSGNIELTSFLWLSTNAITSISFSPSSGSFSEYSSFALYGIAG